MALRRRLAFTGTDEDRARAARAHAFQADVEEWTRAIVAWLVAVGAAVFGVAALASGALPFALVAGFVVAGLVPDLVRAGLVRAGWWRVAQLHARFQLARFGGDGPGDELFALGLCHLRHRRPEIATAIDLALDRLSVIGPGATFAAGARAWVAGDTADARRLWRFTLEFDRWIRRSAIAGWAIDLLLADAAARGAFHEVDALLDHPARPPGTRLSALLRVCRRRQRGEPVSDETLWLAWVLAGASADAKALVVRARGFGGSEAPSDAVRPPVVPDGALERALAVTWALTPGVAVRADVATAADAWSAALAAERGRITSLAGPAPDPVGAIRTRVVDGLCKALDRAPGFAVGAPVPDEKPGELFAEVVWRVADARAAELGWLGDELGRRAAAKRALPLVEEVRAFCALCEAFERVVAVSPDRASASFPALYYPAVAHTVWLHNHRGQARVANAMYRVELRYAELASHPTAIRLLQHNVACRF